MVSSEENQPADDDIRDLQNKRKFSTFGMNPNFEPYSASYGYIFSLISKKYCGTFPHRRI